MNVEAWRIILLITFLTELPDAEVLEHFNLQELILPTKECNLIVASKLAINQGNNSYYTNRHGKKK